MQKKLISFMHFNNPTRSKSNTIQPNPIQMAENEMRELNNLRAELSTLKQQMTDVQKKIKEMEGKIYTKCDHVWTIDRTNVGEHTEYVCVHCNMPKTV